MSKADITMKTTILSSPWNHSSVYRLVVWASENDALCIKMSLILKQLIEHFYEAPWIQAEGLHFNHTLIAQWQHNVSLSNDDPVDLTVCVFIHACSALCCSQNSTKLPNID